LLMGDGFAPRLQAVGSNALEVGMTGAPLPRIELLPAPHIETRDLRVPNRGNKAAAAGKTDLQIEPMVLLHHEVHIDGVVLRRLVIPIEKSGDAALPAITRFPRAILRSAVAHTCLSDPDATLSRIAGPLAR